MASKDKSKSLKVEFILLCDYAFISQGGKPGLIGIFDLLGVPKTPSGHPEMFLFAHLKGAANAEHTLELKVQGPNGKEMRPSLGSAIMKVRLSGTGQGNVIHRFLNFPIQNIGKYKFSLHEEGKRVGETRLSVIKIRGGAKQEAGTKFPN
jgi:hypothetical protein